MYSFTLCRGCTPRPTRRKASRFVDRWNPRHRSIVMKLTSSYPPEFGFVSYPTGWRVPEFTKINGDDTHTTWEHVSQYILQWGEASFNDDLRVH